MPTRPAISIITPTHNRRPVLERAIRSVQRQNFADYEHVIVDDASQDDTESFVRGLDDPHIRYLRFPQWRGANAARNAGIDQARSEWITFLDSDDEYLAHRLNVTTRLLRSSACQLLISSFQTMKRGQPRVAVNPGIYLSPRELEQALVTHSIFIAGSCITIRRNLLIQAGSFDENIWRMQDRDVLLRLARHCGAQLLAGVDWVKHPSPDSISGAPDGYVTALGALFVAHPDLRFRYRDLIAYHLARHVLSDLIGFRLSRARRALAENNNSAALSFTNRELIRSYFAGSAERRAFKNELRQRSESTAVVLAADSWPEPRSYPAPAYARAA